MEFLYILLVILVVTRAFGEIALRFQQPALIGNLVGAILLGLVVHQFEGMFPVLSELTDNDTFTVIADLGVFFLMLVAGLEMHPKELFEASTKALLVALAGLLAPLATGLLLAWYFIPASEWKTAQVMFVGTALAITAIPVAVNVLMDLGQLHTRAGKIIISAAIFDDILGLILLAILTALIASGETFTASNFIILLGRVTLFFIIVTLLGWYVLPVLSRWLKHAKIEKMEFSLLLVTGLGFALIAELLHLHYILGAFMAGLFFTHRTFGTNVYKHVMENTHAITAGFLAPFFFASIGLHLDLSALLVIPGFVLLLVFLAMISKFLGAGLAAWWVGLRKKDAAGVGFGMSARGAVELIIADIALRAGLFNQPDPPPPVVE
ncbi:MAG: cation:proton antiporter, partial [Gammaproteobacteria bacterium]